MKRLLLIALLFAASACTTNGVYDGRKTWTLIGGVVVAGYITTKNADDGKKVDNCHWMTLPGNDMIWVCP